MNLDSVNIFLLQYSHLNILLHLSYLFVIYYKFLELVELDLDLVELVELDLDLELVDLDLVELVLHYG